MERSELTQRSCVLIVLRNIQEIVKKKKKIVSLSTALNTGKYTFWKLTIIASFHRKYGPASAIKHNELTLNPAIRLFITGVYFFLFSVVLCHKLRTLNWLVEIYYCVKNKKPASNDLLSTGNINVFYRSYGSSSLLWDKSFQILEKVLRIIEYV